MGASSAGFVQQSLELVDVDSHSVAVEPVAIALARDGIAEEPPRVSDRLVETVAASLRILAWPERLEDLVALGAFAPEREEGDQLERAGAQAAAALLAAVDRERAEERDERAFVRLRVGVCRPLARAIDRALRRWRRWCLVRHGDQQARFCGERTKDSRRVRPSATET